MMTATLSNVTLKVHFCHFYKTTIKYKEQGVTAHNVWGGKKHEHVCSVYIDISCVSKATNATAFQGLFTLKQKP